jgi:hypothetical protein
MVRQLNTSTTTAAASSSPASTTSDVPVKSTMTAQPFNPTTTSIAENLSKKCASNNSVAIGAGVGIPLGLLVVGLLGFLFTRDRKKRNVVTGGNSMDTLYRDEAKAPTYEIDTNVKPTELPTSEHILNNEHILNDEHTLIDPHGLPKAD